MQRYTHDILDPLIDNNPITVQILGLCSALAVTSSLAPALAMSAAVTCVLVFANITISLLRNLIPRNIRLIIEMTLVATAVIVVDQALRAFAPELARVLSVFVGLIVTNCIVLARAESFAMHNTPLKSLADALGNGAGYSAMLICVGAVRELLGSGTLLGYAVWAPIAEGGWYTPNRLMLLTPSAFFVIGVIVWALHRRTSRRVGRVAGAAVARRPL